ncbi:MULTISPECIES: potassium-transporting ATPase subunit C, partial [unclassified Mucilaginibacter]
QHTETPLMGLFGPAKVNVLKLNVALDELKK